jgi:hypothetical protein
MKKAKAAVPYHPAIVAKLRNKLCRAGYTIGGRDFTRRFTYDFVAGHLTSVVGVCKGGTKLRMFYETVLVVGCVEKLDRRTLSRFYEEGIPSGIAHLRHPPHYTTQQIICVCVVPKPGKDVIRKLRSMCMESSTCSVFFMPLILRADTGRIITCKLETGIGKGYSMKPLAATLKLLTMSQPARIRAAQ